MCMYVSPCKIVWTSEQKLILFTSITIKYLGTYKVLFEYFMWKNADKVLIKVSSIK